MVSLAATSNASIDLGRDVPVATATAEDDGDSVRRSLLFEGMSARKFESSVFKESMLSAIPEENFSKRSEILNVAWL